MSVSRGLGFQKGPGFRAVQKLMEDAVGKLTKEVFNESCCDGGATCNAESAQPCGCDPGENYVCETHLAKPVPGLENLDWDGPGPRMVVTPNMETRFVAPNPIRHFATGATRNTDTSKFDYEGFLNPEALHAFGEYMHEHRHQRDGSIRDADNWQKGIPFRVYVKSLVRHAIDLWRMDRGYAVTNPDTGLPHTKQELCCALVFNAMGYLKEVVDPSPINKENV